MAYSSSYSSSGLYQSPSYHHVSPLSRNRSGSLSLSSSNVRRSNSFSSSRSGGYTMPSYGYGEGFMGRSLSRSNSNLSLFGRSLSSTALHRTPPLHNVGVQRSTPYYTDKYPYVKYSYGNTDSSLAVASQTDLTSKHYPSIKDTGTRRWLEGKLNAYNPGLFSRNSVNYINQRTERPITPARSYTRYMPVDDAVDMYKKNYMTVSSLSKYWLSPTTTQSRRDRDLGSLSTFNAGKYSYGSKYDNTRPTYYSKVASRLSSRYA
jgi:hypothetical protein